MAYPDDRTNPYWSFWDINLFYQEDHTEFEFLMHCLNSAPPEELVKSDDCIPFLYYWLESNFEEEDSELDVEAMFFCDEPADFYYENCFEEVEFITADGLYAEPEDDDEEFEMILPEDLMELVDEMEGINYSDITERDDVIYNLDFDGNLDLYTLSELDACQLGRMLFRSCLDFYGFNPHRMFRGEEDLLASERLYEP
jgi:hypothetical protein